MSQKTKRGTARITISLSQKVYGWAEELCAVKGYDNFSAYIAELIRKDKERDIKKVAAPASTYPPHRISAQSELNEKDNP